jgi:excinuclease ABC subunit C
MADQGAELALARLLAEEGSQRERTRALIEALDLDIADPDTLRIECFDVSHTAGEAAQASCVVYDQHQMQSSQYRRFNIEGITGGDDYAAMRQVLTRRYAKLAEALARDAAEPAVEAADAGDLAAGEALPQLPKGVRCAAARPGAGRRRSGPGGDGARGVPGPGPGPRPDRRRREGRGPQGRSGGTGVRRRPPKVWLGHDSAALMLVAQIRDEAHRFAITGMRARRASVRTGSSRLEEIPGVGPRKRAACCSALAACAGSATRAWTTWPAWKGISKELAEEIYRALH